MIAHGPSHGYRFRKKPAPASKAFAIIEFGSHKIACLILRGATDAVSSGPANQQVLGFSIVQAAGLAGGQIHDMPSAGTAVRNALGAAEAQAGVRVSTAIVTGSFYGLRCNAFNARFGGFDAIQAGSQAAIFTAAYHDAAADRRHLAHVFARTAQTSADHAPHDTEPDTDLLSITFPLDIAVKMVRCCAQACVQATEFIAAPVASGFIAADPGERLEGAALIEIGASTTAVAVFAEGVPVCVETFLFGGVTVTQAIADAFHFDLGRAEQLKLRHATAFGGLIADRDLPFRNQRTGLAISKADLNRLVRQEAANQVMAVNERLKGKGYLLRDCAVILTGGASQLPGLVELTSEITGGMVRLGSFFAPGALKSDPSLAALFGAFSFVSRHQYRGEIALPSRRVSQGDSYAARIGGWLRTSF